MSELKSPSIIPDIARRAQFLPLSEDGVILSAPKTLRAALLPQDPDHELAKRLTVREFVPALDDGYVETDQGLSDTTAKYLKLVKERRNVQQEQATRSATQALERQSGLRGLSSLFAGSEDAAHAQAEDRYSGLRTRLRQIAAARKFPARPNVEQKKILAQLAEDIDGRATFVGLLRLSDAKRKERAYRTELAAVEKLDKQARFYKELLRVRKQIEEGKEPNVEQTFEVLADSLLRDRLVEIPRAVPPESARATCVAFIKLGLNVAPEILRARLAKAQATSDVRKRQLADELNDPRNAELAEHLQHRKFEQLLERYHIHGQRFLEIGSIVHDQAELERIVTSPHGQISRALLYGPPGTGKTEGLREIGRKRGQFVRTVSIHETSSFESLVGANQIPLPKSESMSDGEKHWETIRELSSKDLLEHIPQPILDRCTGNTPEEKAQDYRRWYELKLKTARAIAALGAVAPDDPRIKRARQEALAAWLDQPVTEGLINGDLIILDEADRAGSALEGLQDLLTRRPGDFYQPAGRTEGFQIHPDARIVMTANWGDLATEQTGGGGKITAAISSRVIEIRKVGYLDAATELQLFEIMSSHPCGESLLTEKEYVSAQRLIEKAFPKLRDLYLRPGELEFITPISVRTLENIARRLIDPTTHLRQRSPQGTLVHFVEAVWHEMTNRLMRDDQTKRIKETLVRILSDSGVFECLSDTAEAPRYLQVARLTGLDPNTIKPFMATTSNATQLPPNFYLADQLDQKRATNPLNLPTLIYPSPKAAKQKAEKESKRQIEELGGEPEKQALFAQLLETWARERAARPEKIQKDIGLMLKEDKRCVSKALQDIETISVGDVRALIERFPLYVKDLERGARSASGLVLALAYNKMIARLTPEMRKHVRLTINMPNDIRLDYVGYEMSDGELILEGDAYGNDIGRNMRGGKLTAATVGHRLGQGMTGGIINAVAAGNHAGRDMRGGELKVLQAGARFAERMRGGKATALQAGDYAGCEAEGGTIRVEQCGAHAGLHKKSNVTLTIGKKPLDEIEIEEEV